jgi:hypothetical protein
VDTISHTEQDSSEASKLMAVSGRNSAQSDAHAAVPSRVDHRFAWRRQGVRGVWRAILLCALLTSTAPAVTPESPEVLAVADKALKFLESENGEDSRLGGKCLIALAFHKRGMSEGHPRIMEAVEACRSMVENEEDSPFTYSKGLAVIFLSELNADAHRELIAAYADMLKKHQKPHGGFGYVSYQTGDTSQTQYAALAFWQMLNHGMTPDATSVQNCLKWLMRTQDPSGVWGYQGTDAGTYSLVKQYDNPGVSMGAAGLGSTLILSNSLGLLKPPEKAEVETGAPSNLPALRRTDVKERAAMATLPAGDVDRAKLEACIRRGNVWFDKNFTVAEPGSYQYYYLYSLERYKSFQEFLSGEGEEEPAWYQAGFEFLKKGQAENGSWTDSCGAPCSTAFAVLFLLRSTQKSIEASLGEGTLVGGRGLPRDLSKVKLRGGKLVVADKPTELDQLLELFDETKAEALEELADQPAALDVGDAGPEQARRLQQVARSGPPKARLLAVRALAKLRNMNYAPTLIFALSDPDKRVVREARDGLRSVSRIFEGFGPPDNFDDRQQDEAVERWKKWYATVRPEAPPLP